MAPQSLGIMGAKKDINAMVAVKSFTSRDFKGLASDSRKASVPYCFMMSSGSTTLPSDLDIFLPALSRTMP